MMSALLILGTGAGVAAAWGANRFWLLWEREYRDKHRAPPPGGDTSGYAIVIGAFLAVSVLTTKTLLWIG
jgi:hypothetical protein